MFTRVSRDPTTPPTNSLGAKIWRVSHETVPKASQHDPSRLMARKRDEPVRLTRIYTRGGDAGRMSRLDYVHGYSGRENQRLLDQSLDKTSSQAHDLLVRWGRLHAVRSLAGAISFLMFVLFR